MGSKHQEGALDIQHPADPGPGGCPPPRPRHGAAGHRTLASLSWLQKGLLSAASK